MVHLPTMRTPIESAAVWRAADLADPGRWTAVLTDQERAEIVAATATARAQGATVATMDRQQFPLPSLAVRAEAWSRQLSDGPGFVLLRRFPIDLLDEADTELAYVGLGTHLGTPVGQDKDATLLGHVRDEGVARHDPSVRFYRTNARQDFHTDGADLVGLLCLHRAAAGGESRIASSAAVYNEVLRRRPDLLEVLYQPFCWDRNDEQSPGEDPYFELPVIHDVGGLPRVFFIGWYITDAQRHPEVPRLTPEQLEALALVESIANDPAFHLEMDFQPGDIQLLDNGRILHAREAFEDDPDPSQRRHLLRLWLVAHRYSSVEAFLQQGIPAQRP